MTTILSCSRTVLLAAMLSGGLVAAVAPAAAQQSPASPAPAAARLPAPAAAARAAPAAGPAIARASRAWTQAMPETPSAANLAPVSRRRSPLPPTNCRWRHCTCPRTSISRSIRPGWPTPARSAVDDKGTVFVSTRVLDRVYAIVNRNGKREAKILVKGLQFAERHRPPRGRIFLSPRSTRSR